MFEIKTITLHFLNSNVVMLVEDGVQIDRVIDFFSTHFVIHEPLDDTSSCIATIRIQKGEADLANYADNHGWESVYIRKSASAFFTIPAVRQQIGEKEHLFCKHTNTLLTFDASNKSIEITSGDITSEAFNLILIELIRDVVIKNEENEGTVILHASCAFRNGLAYLITGPKGSGKTTTIMELVHRFGYQLMSGDKTFLFEENGVLMASGWPDYPHIGIGTLTKYPEVIKKVNMNINAEEIKDIWSPKHKVAVDPQLFRELMPSSEPGVQCPVAYIFYPTVSSSPDCFIESLSDHQDRIGENIETIPENSDSSWNHYIKVNHDKLQLSVSKITEMLEQVQALRIIGSGVLPEHESILLPLHSGG